MLMRQCMLVAFTIILLPVPAEAQWGYLTPPWNFNVRPKYAGKEMQSIPMDEWEQLAAFDTAVSCEKGRLFARDIRNLSPGDREYLMSLFASGAEERAKQESQPLLLRDSELKKKLNDQTLTEKAETTTLKWWSASKCVPLSSVHP
jgi:hypothetical protein